MISHLFREIMGEKPYLSVEVDEHQSAVGVVTRIEAFLNSLKHVENRESSKREDNAWGKCNPESGRQERRGQERSELGSNRRESCAAGYDGIPLLHKLQKNAVLHLPPLSVYTELYARWLRNRGYMVHVSPDYTRKDMETGKAESISKEYATFSAMAGQILRQEKRWNEIPGGVLQAESLQEEEKAQKEGREGCLVKVLQP